MVHVYWHIADWTQIKSHKQQKEIIEYSAFFTYIKYKKNVPER